MAIVLDGTAGITAPAIDAALDATDLTGTVASARLPAGSVLQVVSTTKTNTFSQSVASGAISGDVTGLTATITPISANNKILVLCHITGGGASQNGIVPVLHRGGAIVAGSVGDASGSRSRVSSSASDVGSDVYTNATMFSFFDSPSSTAALTYSIRCRHYSNGTQLIFVNRSVLNTDAANRFRSASTITLMEIAA